VARDRLLGKLLKQVFECFTQRLALIRGKRAEPFLVDDELLIRIFEWLGRATSLVLRRWRVLLSDRFVDVLFHVAIAPILLESSSNGGARPRVRHLLSILRVVAFL